MSLVVPERLEQQAILAGAMVALRAGSSGPLPVLGTCCGVSVGRELDFLVELLLTANQRIVSRAMAATHPARYVRGAVREQIAASSIQEPQERMVEIDSSDYAGEPLEAVHGIDPVEYVAALRASGRARDLRLADSIEAYYCDDARKQDVGDADYQQMLDFFDSPRARSIGRRTKRWFVRPRTQVGGGVMAMANWTRTTGTKNDSVWHTGCLHLLEKKSSQRASTAQPR
jgi:hypothetical protein